MKGDFSRKTFKKEKNYSGVLKQQGRVSLDADWNESIDIIAHQRQTRTADTIGVCGAPIHSSGFAIRHPGDGNPDNLLITTGRFYVEGLLCELHPTGSVSIEFVSATKAKLKELKIDQAKIQPKRWIVISTKEHSNGMVTKVTRVDKRKNVITIDPSVPADYLSETAPILRLLILYRDQPDYPEVPKWTPEPGKTYLVYLDVWQRHITAIEDPEILEVALKGPDTDTRIKEISRVEIFPEPVEFEECKDVIPFDRLFPPSSARLKTQVVAGTTPEDPCLIAEGVGYRGLENRLYRVEIHQGGDVGTAKFKWSRDNGSIAYAIQEFIPDETDPTKVFKVKLKQIGRDKILKIKENDWLEISGDETDFDVENAGTISQVTHVDEAQRILTLSVDVAQHKDEDHPKVRRWDTGIDTVTSPTLTASGPINLEDGVQISFAGGNFRVGDYWVFAARTTTGEVEELDYEPPQGIKHHYCKLALVNWKDDSIAEIKDCRPEFYPLTELTELLLYKR